jgi:hypothetical protein
MFTGAFERNAGAYRSTNSGNKSGYGAASKADKTYRLVTARSMTTVSLTVY